MGQLKDAIFDDSVDGIIVWDADGQETGDSHGAKGHVLFREIIWKTCQMKRKCSGPNCYDCLNHLLMDQIGIVFN